MEGDVCERGHAEQLPYIFLSTPSGWRATFILIQKLRYYFISIHALRVEGDLVSFADRLGKIDISIHALRVEGDKLSRYAVWCAQ